MSHRLTVRDTRETLRRWAYAAGYLESETAAVVDRVVSQVEREVRLAGVTEAASLMRVSRQRATQLSQRPGFPAPVAVLAMGPVWLRADLERYQLTRNTKPGRPRLTENENGGRA